MENIVSTSNWDLRKRILFRFICSYLILYNLPFPIGELPFTSYLSTLYYDMWFKLVPWVGKHILHLSYDIKVFPNGSGDTTFNYVQLLCFLVIATLVTLIWSFFDRKRPNYETLCQWLRFYVRIPLATAMMAYGGFKVIQSQFPAPSLDRLIQPFGDASPMGLAWTFMGASYSYNFFAGMGEMLAGFLLIFPQTITLGALVAIGVMSNVVMLNFSYDIPVKLYSSHLLMMAIFLTFPDLKRLANILVFNRSVEKNDPKPLFTRVWLNRTIQIIAGTFILYVGVTTLLEAQENRKTYGDLAPKPPLYGIWTVEEFEIDGQIHPPLTTDESRWQHMVFNYPQSTSIYLMNNLRKYYGVKVSLENKTLVLEDYGQGEDESSEPKKYNFTLEQPEVEVFTLNGKMQDHEIRAKFRRRDEKKFLLTSRGFHWINEYPFNR